MLPGKETGLRIRYAVVSAADLIPSHDARAGFEPNAYGDLNERDYRDPTEGKALRENVFRMRDKLNPAMLHADSPTAVDGPPIVNSDLVAMGGNARSMLQQLVYHEGGDRAEFLAEAVRTAASKFGIAPSEIQAAGIKDPVIVRIVDDADAGKPGELSRILNQSLTAARTSDTDSVSRGRKITAEHAIAIARLLPADGTLADVFNSRPDSENLVNALIRAGAMNRDDLVAYTDTRGLLNQEGRRLVERTLLGAAVPDVRRLAEIQPQLRQTLIRAIPAITKLRGAKDAGFDVDEVLGLALDVLKDYRDANARSISHLIEQSSMFPQPWRENRRAIALASALLEETPTTIQSRFNRLAGLANEDAGPGLFGPVERAGFDEVFPYDGPEPGDAGAGPTLFDLEDRANAKGQPPRTGSAGPTPPKWPPMPPGAMSSPYVAGTLRIPGAPPQALNFRDPLRPVGMPELIKLARAIGVDPKIRTDTGARGYLKWSIGGKAELVIDAGTAADAEGLAKTLAHEIGHLIDFMDDREMRRGNVLGRVLGLKPILNHLGQLRSFMADTFPLASATNKELRKELVDLTRWWKPYSPATSSPAFVQYRESAVELYADALSVLLNSPGTLAERAPKFYRELLTHLHRKPEVLKAYLELQDLLAGHPDDIRAARRADIREDFAAGDVIMARAAEARAGRQSVVEWVNQMLFDTAAPLIAKERGAGVAGVRAADRRAASIAMEEFALRDNAARITLGRVQRHVHEPMLEAGITKEDAGEFLMMNRIVNGDRQAFGNPRGHTPETAADALAYLKQTLGPDRYRVLERSMHAYQDIVFGVAEDAVNEGVYSIQAFREKIEPNRGFYATFAVLDHLEDFIPYQIMQQIGTFKGIANPFDATLMKTVSLHRAIELNRAKRRALVEGIGRWFPSEVTLHKPAPGMDPPKPRDGYENLPYLINGRVAFLEVDRYVAKAFKRHDIGVLNRLGAALSKAVYTVFHPLYVTFSASFSVANIFRDVKRTYTNLSVVGKDAPTMGQVLKAYWKARDAAWARATSHYDPTIEAMLDDRALGVPFSKYDPTDESVGYDKLLKDAGLLESNTWVDWVGSIFRPAEFALRFAHRASDFTETLPKVAAYRLLGERGVGGSRRAYIVRNYVGTPNTARRGLATTLTNSLFMYSNVALQGIRADADIALRPKTASGWWLRAMLVDFLPKMAMRAATLGLFGEAVRQTFELIPEYDKATYVVIPLGTTTDENGREKAVYLRVPHGDTNRLLAAPLWLLSQGMGSKAAAELFGQLPTTVNPYLDSLDKWATYLQGNNPYDDFRNRAIIHRDAFEAGGTAALTEMARWQLNEFGVASTLLHYIIGYPGQARQEQGTVERVIGSIPGLERLLKISDRGVSEDQWAAVDRDERERAVAKLALPQNARTLTSKRYRLQRLHAAGSIESEQQIELLRLNAWYRNVYLPLTKQINQLEETGNPELADRLRARLELLTDAFSGG